MRNYRFGRVFLLENMRAIRIYKANALKIKAFRGLLNGC